MDAGEGREVLEAEVVVPAKINQGKDEMNLAEFPLSAISERTDPNQKTFVFEDRVWDESRGETVTRQLTVTASDQYGLPTAHDDEVILGLIQLSKLQGFSDRRVPFTRYQLIQLLGWRDESKSYDRLEKSLSRWVGVTLDYKNAWRDKEMKSWVDEKFHIIDNVTLYDREKGAARRRAGQAVPQLSSFTWNDVLFRSFSAGNLKSLDFDFYKSLDSAIAKRLYRFLDKRFFHRKRWEFNLKEVSWEHIGLSRNYDSANLKRKLLPAIKELEGRKFLTAMHIQERFKKVRSGEWRVVFERAGSKSNASTDELPDESQQLIRALTDRGVTPSTAEHTVKSFPAERIHAQLEVFDWLVSQKDSRVSRNPAGFLVTSIKGEYVAPPGFVSREERASKDALAEERKRKAAERAKAEEERERASRLSKEAATDRFWQSLSDDERARLEAEALEQASPFQRSLIEKGGGFARATKKAVFDAYALKALKDAA